MKNLKKRNILIIFMILVIIGTTQVYAKNNKAKLLKRKEYTEEFEKYLKLPEEEKNKVLIPRIYEIEKNKKEIRNPFAVMATNVSANVSKFDLREKIKNNVEIKNQKNTGECWAFSAISSLETTLAMNNYKKNINKSKVYNYSERHMDYSNYIEFANGQINPYGYSRGRKGVNDENVGGNVYMALSYLTNGNGAVLEEDMPFEDNEDIIDISKIQNKNIMTEVKDTIDFPDYQTAKDETEKAEIINRIKLHIKEYGAVTSSINSSSANLENGSIFGINQILNPANHAISIIGWDDNYPVENFTGSVAPKNKGAWIVRNSWGKQMVWNLKDIKETIYRQNTEYCQQQNWTTPEMIPNDFIEKQFNVTIDKDKVYGKVGDNGIFYASYEDCNISKAISGIKNVSDVVSYDNIYQYDYFYPINMMNFANNQIMLANIFDKKNLGKEYVTEISVFSPDVLDYEVYINEKSDSLNLNDFKSVKLKYGNNNGKYESLDFGYHRLEFAEPVEITGNKFVVMVKAKSKTGNISFTLESNFPEAIISSNLKNEKGKSFIKLYEKDSSNWIDTSEISKENPDLIDGDITIKAYTVNKLYDESLQKLVITTPPTKINYVVGENFDKTGMKITAEFNSKIKPTVELKPEDYNIENGNNLIEGQKSVTISYKDKKVEQPITVTKKAIKEIKITTPPNKVNYKEGESFDKTGITVEVIYEDGTSSVIENYTIENDKNLKPTQTEIIIKYEGKIVKQPITVKENKLMKIEITKEPNKTEYVVGEDFDKTGMQVSGTHQDGAVNEIFNYIVENGTKLTKEQTSVTIKYEDKIVEQPIKVVEKTIVDISIETLPIKTKYIQNKEKLDLTGGKIKVQYNDGTLESILMNSEEVKVTGFDNSKVGKIKLDIEYLGKRTQMELEIVSKTVPKEEKAINSDLTKIIINIEPQNVDGEYQMAVHVKNINKPTTNDSLEYYYYVSNNSDEKNITNWVKITEKQNSDNSIDFVVKLNSLDSTVLEADTAYLYIKEVAKKGSNQSIAISNAMELTANNSDINVETMPGNKDDASNKFEQLPFAGMTSKIIILLIAISLIGIIYYKKYKKYKKI